VIERTHLTSASIPNNPTPFDRLRPPSKVFERPSLITATAATDKPKDDRFGRGHSLDQKQVSEPSPSTYSSSTDRTKRDRLGGARSLDQKQRFAPSPRSYKEELHGQRERSASLHKLSYEADSTLAALVAVPSV
jgi:hypothetical protein